jgi:hypothetical protein
MKRQTQYNFRFNPKIHAENNTLPSVTVPDESFSIKDILHKFTRGIDPMLTRMGDYDNENCTSDLEDTAFTVNPIRNVTDLTDIGEIEEFVKTTKKNEKVLLKRIEELKKSAENSAT